MQRLASNRLALLVLNFFSILLFVIPAQAQRVSADSSGSVSGRISGPDGAYFIAGARVEIKELNRSSFSDREGMFNFPRVNTGSYTLEIQYLGSDNLTKTVQIVSDEDVFVDFTLKPKTDSDTAIVVTGSRAVLASARNKERTSDTYKNVIASDVIGGFADQNIAESLQRLPGVSIERDSGEGKFVTVRGLSSRYTNVEFDGIKIGGGEGGELNGARPSRGVRLDTFSSDVLESIELIKTPTPEMEGDSLGGTISLRSLSAFDRNFRSIKFRLEGSQQDIIEEANLKGTFSFTDRFDIADGELGVAFVATAQQRDIGRTQFNSSGPFVAGAVDAGGNTVIPSDGSDTFLIPDRLEDVYRTNERDRTGLTLNLDYHASDDHRYYFRTSLNKTEQDTVRYRNRYDLGSRIEDDGLLSDVDEVQGLGLYVGEINDADIFKEIRTGSFTDQTKVFSVGGINNFDYWTVDYKLGLSQSEDGNDEPSFSTRWRSRDSAVAYQGGVNDGRIVSVVAQEGEDDPFSADSYELNRVLVSQNSNTDDIASFQVNAELVFGDDHLLKFGFKSTRRERELTFLDEIIGNGIVEDLEIFGNVAGNENFLNELELVGVNIRSVDDLSSSPNGLLFFPDAQGYSQLIDSNRSTLVEIARDEGSQAENGYSLTEDIFATYVQLTYNISDSWRFVGGVRFELTDFESGTGFYDEDIDYADISGVAEVNQIDGSEFAVGGFDNQYSDFLPRFLFRYEPSEKLIMRFSYSSAVQRPDFDSINPSALINTDENEVADVGDGTFNREIRSPGNPALESARSNQLDAYLTWYPNRNGVFQVGLFGKIIDDFFVSQTLTGQDVNSIGLAFNASNVLGAGFNQASGVTVNGGEAEIGGLELSYSQSYDFGGFFSGSWTVIDSEADYGELRIGERLPLAGQSDNVGNVSFGWENESLTFTFSATYQDEMFLSVGETAETDLWIDTAIYADVGLQYRLNDNFGFYADVINVFGEERVRFFQDLQQPWFEQAEDFGTTIQIGITGSF